MIIIELDLTTVLVAVVSSVVSILGSAFVTWYFSRRHYTRTPQPVTENDIILRDNENGFRFLVIFFVLLFLMLITIILASVCTDRRVLPEDDVTRPPVSLHPYPLAPLLPAFMGTSSQTERDLLDQAGAATASGARGWPGIISEASKPTK